MERFMSDQDNQVYEQPILTARRRPVSLSAHDLVKTKFLDPLQELPLVVEPKHGGLDLCGWVKENLQNVDQDLRKYGGVLFRNFNVDTIAKFEQVGKAISGELLEYKERSSPRTQISGKVYTSTDYPPEHHIFLHNENSYQRRWPLKIFFCCITPAKQQGATPIADVRKVAQHIPEEIKDKFRRKKVMYTRTFGQGLGLAWEVVFQTTDKAAIEKHCNEDGIAIEWLPDNRLRTRAVREAFRWHPKTAEWLWFNHATFFHVSTREPELRDSLRSLFPEDELPTNSFYGDGSAIEPEVLDILRAAYHKETVRFSWEKGDVMLLDNMMVAHGREPFVGSRKIAVGMAEPVEFPGAEPKGN
jgi:alpha-ketoglutarate-dependent taurine dioxygenase